MTSPIRELLAQAQAAELGKNPAEAVRLLQEAERQYRANGQTAQAERMRRQIGRLGGGDEDDFGFGEVLEPEGKTLAAAERGPALADPALDAWCSFCCKPRAEVGELVAGPAGAFICKSCLGVAVVLVGGQAPVVAAPPPKERAPNRPSFDALPAQRRLLERFASFPSRLTLVVGPSGSGKSAVARLLGRLVRSPQDAQADDEVLVLDGPAPLSPGDEEALLRWLKGSPRRRAVLLAQGELGAPLLTLEGDAGAAPVYDTEALARAAHGVYSAALLRQVDAVYALEAPTEQALRSLGESFLRAAGVELAAGHLDRLVTHALKSGQGAHELMALLSRIPPGRYR